MTIRSGTILLKFSIPNSNLTRYSSSSTSDSNTHALLRSSIGQSVTSLPPKFTVAALYLFLLWISLFIVDLLKGPIQIVLLVLVSIMFFQVVIPLSAFGRLIIHTGAMAKRPVLDKELEKELLPSGLHASLLIRATDRRRKYSSATDQYRKQNLGSKRLGSGSIPSVSNAASSSIPSSYFLASQPLGNNLHPPRNISINRPRSESDELTSDESASSVQNPVDEEATGASHTERPFRAHRRIETFDTVGSDLFFPGASILNASTSRREIKDVVDKSMYMSSMPGDIATNSTFSVSMASTNQNDKDNPNEMSSTKRPNDNEDKWYKGTKSSGRVLGLGREGGFDAADGDPNAKSTIMSPSLDASPTLSGSRKIHPSNGTLHRDMINFHPLLTRSPAQRRPPAHRPPKHQRGLSSASRRSSGSLLGFIREFEEENEVRALFDVPPAADLEAQERLVDGIEASTQVQQNPSTQPTTIPEESMENGQAKSIKKKSTRPTHKDENSAMEATHLLGGKGSGSNYI